jgi:O-antigen ligase
VTPATATPAPTGDRLATASRVAFLLLVVSVTGPIAPMGITAVLCAVLTLARFARAPRPRWPATPVNRAALGWIVALALASAFALEPAHSVLQLKKGLLPLLVGLAAFHGADARLGRRALALYLAASGAVAIVGIAEWWRHGHGYAWRAQGLANHYMTFGGQLLFELAPALALAMLARPRRWRAGAAAVALLTAVALAATFTRSSWLGAFAAAAIVAGAVWPWGVGLLAALAALAWGFAPGQWGVRIHHMFDSHFGYNGERLLMWQAGWRMFREHPLTGVGLEDLHALYQRYKLPQATEAVGHLHNTYVQVAAGMGLVGLAAFGWLYAALLRAASPGVAIARGFAARLRAGGEGAALRLGVTAALAGFLVTACFEFNFGDEELLYQLFVLVGLAWASRSWEPAGPPAAGAAGERAPS